MSSMETAVHTSMDSQAVVCFRPLHDNSSQNTALDCGGNNLGGDIPSVQYYPPLQDDHVDAEPRSMTMLSDDPNRVREEVIAKEVERRLIEEQVRRELALGREVLMERWKHGGPSLHSERSYPFPVTLESVLLHPLHPFERLPLEARKGLRRKDTVKPIVEVGRKPSPPLEEDAEPKLQSGMKRKATLKVLSSSDDKGDNISNAKKSTKSQWSCSLCQINATSQTDLNHHLQGKKHKAKALKSPCNAQNDLSQKQLSSEKKIDEAVVQIEEAKSEYFCESCEVECHSLAVYQSHLKGRKHKTRISKAEVATSSSSHEVVPPGVELATEKQIFPVNSHTLNDREDVSEDGSGCKRIRTA